MSLRTQIIITGILAALGAFPFPSPAHASQADFNNAMNEFYRHFRASSDKSAATIHKLQSEIIDPALKDLTHGSSNKGSGMSVEEERSPSEQSAEPVSQPIMDAKDVPSEIDFPGNRAAHPATAKSSASH